MKTATAAVTLEVMVLAAALALVACATAQSDGLVVQTMSGPVEGFDAASGNFSAFLGIPYASAGRWEKPEDPDPWTEAFQATEYGPICAQSLQVVGAGEEVMADQPWNYVLPPVWNQSEDCLSVNVYAPANATDVPVMVWIYGGGLIQGDGNGYSFAPDTLVGKDVVLVTFNYRLGPFGFGFAHPDLNETNFGLYDQIKALEWVQANIEQFGGDPDNVTIFGESSGAASVASLLVSPLTEDLFHRAIIESMPLGLSSSMNVTIEEAAPTGVAFGVALGYSEDDPEQLQKMKEVSFQEVLNTAGLDEFSFGPGLGILVDGESMIMDAVTGFVEGENHKVPVIIGSNANEGGTYYLNPGSQVPVDIAGVSPAFSQYVPANTSEKYEGFVRQLFGSDADKVLSFYPADKPMESGQSMLTDSFYTVGAQIIAEAMANRGEDVRMYHFTQKPGGPAAEIGAFHTTELPYVGIASEHYTAPVVNPLLADQMSKLNQKHIHGSLARIPSDKVHSSFSFVNFSFLFFPSLHCRLILDKLCQEGRPKRRGPSQVGEHARECQ